jgi:ParB family chromosome partitioning protein
MQKKSLGRGLSALIPTLSGGEQAKIVELPTERLKGNPYQPRESIDEQKIEELAESIKQHGIIQPIIVRESKEGYEIVAGERRWRAARKAGLERVPVLIKDFSDEECATIALVENIMREDLNPLEEAHAFRRLIEEFSLKQEELALRLGISRSAVANTLRILSLPPQIQDYLASGKLTKGHAIALLALDSSELQLEVANSVIRNSLSVRETEKIVSLLKTKRKKSSKKAGRIREFRDYEKMLSESTGLSAKIRLTKRGIELKIKMSSVDKLEELVKKLAGQQ